MIAVQNKQKSESITPELRRTSPYLKVLHWKLLSVFSFCGSFVQALPSATLEWFCARKNIYIKENKKKSSSTHWILPKRASSNLHSDVTQSFASQLQPPKSGIFKVGVPHPSASMQERWPRRCGGGGWRVYKNMLILNIFLDDKVHFSANA